MTKCRCGCCRPFRVMGQWMTKKNTDSTVTSHLQSETTRNKNYGSTTSTSSSTDSTTTPCVGALAEHGDSTAAASNSSGSIVVIPCDHGERRVESEPVVELKEKTVDIILLASLLSRPNCHCSQLSLSGCEIKGDQVECLTQALEINQSLCRLSLYRNNLGDDGACCISRALSSSKFLHSFSLENNRIGPDGATFIGKALFSNSSLLCLDLGYNTIGKNGAEVIAQALQSNNSLLCLNLGWNNVGDNGACLIAHALSNNASLLSLDLRVNHIGLEGAKAIAQALMGNRSLINLDLRDNQIGDAGLESISRVLALNKTLLRLGIAMNNITAKGMKVLAEALAANTSLSVLDLALNDMGKEGAGYIAQALALNTNSLVSLDLGWNNLGDAGVSSISEALKINKSLVYLDISHNRFGTRGAESLYHGLCWTKSLRCLGLRVNKIGDAGAKSIARALTFNTCTFYIDLAHNDITEEGAASILNLWNSHTLNTTLTALNVKDNHLGDSTLNEVERAIAHNKIQRPEFGDHNLLWFSWIHQPAQSLLLLSDLSISLHSFCNVVIGNDTRRAIKIGGDNTGLFLVKELNPPVQPFHDNVDILDRHGRSSCHRPSEAAIALAQQSYHESKAGFLGSRPREELVSSPPTSVEEPQLSGILESCVGEKEKLRKHLFDQKILLEQQNSELAQLKAALRRQETQMDIMVRAAHGSTTRHFSNFRVPTSVDTVDGGALLFHTEMLEKPGGPLSIKTAVDSAVNLQERYNNECHVLSWVPIHSCIGHPVAAFTDRIPVPWKHIIPENLPAFNSLFAEPTFNIVMPFSGIPMKEYLRQCISSSNNNSSNNTAITSSQITVTKSLMKGILRAINHLSQNNVVHRNISGFSILISQSQSLPEYIHHDQRQQGIMGDIDIDIKLTDFGDAAVCESDKLDLRVYPDPATHGRYKLWGGSGGSDVTCPPDICTAIMGCSSASSDGVLVSYQGADAFAAAITLWDALCPLPPGVPCGVAFDPSNLPPLSIMGGHSASSSPTTVSSSSTAEQLEAEVSRIENNLRSLLVVDPAIRFANSRLVLHSLL
ncbi:Protein NLRC3 [Pelomyxa schiedti]|nr:Protein NLRC3 [Pelomyxa schiedti]